MVLRAKRAKNGRMMYFKDNKLISKAAYTKAKNRKGAPRKGRPAFRGKRSPARKTKSNGVRRMKKSIPHPSVTGMASGLAIAAYLNAGQATTTATGTSLGNVTVMSDGVIKDIADGQLGAAFNTLSGNAINMIASDAGRKTLVTAGGIAALGAFARRQFPQLKLGGSKLYFRL
jgi:hypothetical protein